MCFMTAKLLKIVFTCWENNFKLTNKINTNSYNNAFTLLILIITHRNQGWLS